MPLTNPNHVVTKQRLADFYQGILPYLGAPELVRPTVYGIHITNGESDPDAKVQYIADAVGMTPAHMDFTNDVFDYGSWSNAFFMPKPCMLKYDGTVDYYLDPSDYTKKADGTASDIGDPTYQGNAMMEWGQNGKKIWLKIVPDGSANNNAANIYISDENADGTYTDWNFHNSAGQSKAHFYTAIYNGSLNDGKLRSISGQQVSSAKTSQQEYDYAQANNPSGSLIWTSLTITDVDFINILLILLCKSTNIQSKFGQGLSANGTELINNSFRTGVHNDKGLFYGTNSGTASTYTNAVKIFGMENWWGFQWKRYVGEVMIGGTRYRKLTYGTEDGSTTTGYNFTGSGYISSDVAKPSGTSGNYIADMVFNGLGLFPKVASATSSTYYCDGLWFNNNITVIPIWSGSSGASEAAGPFCVDLTTANSGAYWSLGTSISARPLT